MLPSSATGIWKPGEQPCLFCHGAGEVAGIVDDIEFLFQCPCSGGNEEAVLWLLGREWRTNHPEDGGEVMNAALVPVTPPLVARLRVWAADIRDGGSRLADQGRALCGLLDSQELFKDHPVLELQLWQSVLLLAFSLSEQGIPLPPELQNIQKSGSVSQRPGPT
jgi:hypothetical protein